MEGITPRRISNPSSPRRRGSFEIGDTVGRDPASVGKTTMFVAFASYPYDKFTFLCSR